MENATSGCMWRTGGLGGAQGCGEPPGLPEAPGKVELKGNAPRRARLRSTPVACRGASLRQRGFPGVEHPGLPGGSRKGWESRQRPSPEGALYGKCNLRLHVARLRGPRPCGKGFPGVRRAPRACREAPERWE